MKLATIISLLVCSSASVFCDSSERKPPGILISKYYGLYDHDHELAKRADTPLDPQTEFNKALDNGRTVSLLLSQRGVQGYQSRITSGYYQGLKDKRWTIIHDPPSLLENIGTILQLALAGTNVDTSSGSNKWYTVLVELTQSQDAKGNPLKATYNNFYSPENGVLVAAENHNQQLQGAHHWSEIVWRVWMFFCGKKGADPSTLTRVIRHKIKNKQTQAVARWIYSQFFINLAYGTKVDIRQDGATQDAYTALLGTSNGIGVGRLFVTQENVLTTTLGSNLTCKQIVTITMQVFEDKLELIFCFSSQLCP